MTSQTWVNSVRPGKGKMMLQLLLSELGSHCLVLHSTEKPPGMCHIAPISKENQLVSLMVVAQAVA